jgi:hypothetical protein
MSKVIFTASQRCPRIQEMEKKEDGNTGVVGATYVLHTEVLLELPN